MKPAEYDAQQSATVGHTSQNQIDSPPASHVPTRLSFEQLRRLAIDHHRAGRIDQALKLYRAVLHIRPNDTGIWCNLGAVLRQQKHFQSAINCYRRALAIKPGDRAVIGNLANALKDLQRFDESLALHQQLVTDKPDDVKALLNQACALREAGRFDTALEQLDRAQSIEPANAGIEWERAQNLLYLGRYREGWAAYEARWRTGDLPIAAFGCPQWRGEEIFGKTILLHSEQGYGDTILAARFIPLVKARVGRQGKVILQCKPELHRLFQAVGADLLIAPDQQLPPIDMHCPLMSLMGALDIQPDTIPAPAQLFIPDEARQKFAFLRSALPFALNGRRDEGESRADSALTLTLSRGERELKIGIVWSGSITFKNNDNRALPLSAFLPLAEVPNIRLYSLQKGPRLSELQENGAEAYIEDLGSRCDDFADTAAAIENLDAIVMTDSSVAHLAASLNKPVINLIQQVPYWLYTLEAEKTPWYVSMKLITRSPDNEWLHNVIAAIKALSANNDSHL